jgi:hypothetical protein
VKNVSGGRCLAKFLIMVVVKLLLPTINAPLKPVPTKLKAACPCKFQSGIIKLRSRFPLILYNHPCNLPHRIIMGAIAKTFLKLVGD